MYYYTFNDTIIYGMIIEPSLSDIFLTTSPISSILSNTHSGLSALDFDTNN